MKRSRLFRSSPDKAIFGHGSDFQSTFGPWGTVAAGDELPFVAKRQAAGSLGVEWRGYSFDARGSFIGDRRTRAGSGDLGAAELLPAHFILDLVGEAQVTGSVSVFGTVRNVFDSVYVASRLPAGLRPGLPRTFLLGVRTEI